MDTLAQQGLVDEFWFWVNPHLWPAGPRILDGVGPIRLQPVAATPYRSGVVWLRYRPAGPEGERIMGKTIMYAVVSDAGPGSVA